MIFKNTFWLAVAEAVTRFLKLILIIYVARILGATEYGKFTFALSFVSLFAIFSDLGISPIVTREISGEKEKEKEFSAVFSLKIILGIVTLVLILIGSVFITLDPIIRAIIWILGIYIILSGFLEIIYAFFRAHQKMEYEAWTKILQALIVTLVGFFVLFNFPSVKNLSFSYLFASLSALIFILLFFHFKVSPIKLNFNKVIWKIYLKMSWPLALAGVFGAIYANTDSAMMGYWGQITQTGWYNAAYKIVGVVLIPAALISQSFFPALSFSFKIAGERLQKIWNYFMEAMIFLAIPIVVGGITFATRIVDFVYDPSYFPSILAFQILIVMAGVSFLCSPLSQILIVANQQKLLFYVSLAGGIINLILNLILIPKYSLYGAAFTTLVTVFLIFFLLFYFTRKLTPIEPFNLKFFLNLICAIFATIPMYFLIIQPKIYHLNIFLSILIGAIIYAIFFLVFKVFISHLKLCKW